MSRMLDFVDQRVAALLDQPDGWGAPESVELALLLLIEMRHTALGSPEVHVDGVNDRYHAFLDREHPGRPTSLAARMGLPRRASDEFVQILHKFVVEECSVLDTPALGALCRSGPWSGRDPEWTLTADELRAYYETIITVAPAPWLAFGLTEHAWGSHPKTGRANTLLKRAGLIRFDRERRRWVAFDCDDG